MLFVSLRALHRGDRQQIIFSRECYAGLIGEYKVTNPMKKEEIP